MKRAAIYSCVPQMKDHWPIKKALTLSDVDITHPFLTLSRQQVENHIVLHMTTEQQEHLRTQGQIDFNARDDDTGEMYVMKLKWRGSYYNLIGKWGRVVRGKGLDVGQEIKIRWENGCLYFSVPKQQIVAVPPIRMVAAPVVQDHWPIKKILTLSDVDTNHPFLPLPRRLVEDHILVHWTPQQQELLRKEEHVNVNARDYDTGEGYIMKFKWRGNFFIKPRPMMKPSKREENLSEETNSKVNQIGDPGSGISAQIEKLVFHKRYHEALDFFELLECEGDCQLDSSTYDALVTACIGLRSIRGVKRVHNHMVSSGLVLDQYLWNRVLLMHVKCKMMLDARSIFDEMPERNSISWNTMVGGLVDLGDYLEAFRLFFMMWEENSAADPRIFATMIRASSGLEVISLGQQLHSCALKMGEGDNRFISCALIDMYSKCGSIEDAQFVFDNMPEKTTVGWNTIIAGYALHGYSEEALCLYYEMRDAGVKMDHFTFSIIIRVCTRLASLEHAKQAHAGLVRHGFGLDIVANTALVDFYNRNGGG